jgi:muramoyltetrapeptide carboxypeptidase
MQALIKPQCLRAGDTVGVAAPASWPDRSKALRAAEVLKEWGLDVQFGRSLSRRHGYLAGTDQERVDEIHQLFADARIKAIFCVCGGYGTPRIAEHLDYDLIRANPKIFWGYSDITFLHVAIVQRAGLVTVHGPMLSSDLGQDSVHPHTKQTFRQMFEPTPFRYSEEISSLRTLVPGKAEGALIGGNLSLLVSTLGTEFEIETKGKLLFIEEVDEEPYRVDRMFNQLRMAGKFADAAGIILCNFQNCVPGKRKESLTLDEVVEDHVLSAGKPTVSGLLIGHCSPNYAIPVGLGATLDAERKTLSIDELPFLT